MGSFINNIVYSSTEASIKAVKEGEGPALVSRFLVGLGRLVLDKAVGNDGIQEGSLECVGHVVNDNTCLRRLAKSYESFRQTTYYNMLITTLLFLISDNTVPNK